LSLGRHPGSFDRTGLACDAVVSREPCDNSCDLARLDGQKLQPLRNLLFITLVCSGLLSSAAQADNQKYIASENYAQSGNQASLQASAKTSTGAKSGPIDLEVNKKQADQKLVFKLAFSRNSFQQNLTNAIEAAQVAYHRLGRYIENLCQGVDNNLKINNRSTPQIKIAPNHMAQIQSHIRAASHAYYAIDRRIKTLAER
jgi:hypothetical protein